MTFLDLCKRLRQEVGAAGNGPSSVASQTGEYARLVSWIRTAWQEIQTERHWCFDWAQGEVDLTTLDTRYALPNDFDAWDADTLRFGVDTIPVVPWSELQAADRLSAVAIAPDGTLHLNAPPKADGVLRFEYWRTPQELANNTDIPRCPERFHLLIAYRAMIQYGLYENAQEVAQQGTINERSLYSLMTHSQLPAVSKAEALA